MGTVSEFGGLEIVCNRCGSHLGRGTQPMTNLLNFWKLDMDVEPKIGVFTPQNGWFRMEKLIRMDDLGVPLFLEAPIFHRKYSLST